uniref:Uncharacterized protein n=1 Tax=Anguilla anguilla TaxID=7936 RepID=A0A0E9RF35_ANGAN
MTLLTNSNLIFNLLYTHANELTNHLLCISA